MSPEKRLFAFSILYLFAIFGALVADKWLGRMTPQDEERSAAGSAAARSSWRFC